MTSINLLVYVAGGVVGALLVLTLREIAAFVVWTVGELVRSRRKRRANRCDHPGCRKQGTISHWTDAADGVELTTGQLCLAHAREVNR